ncbi:MAG: hypothetical protein J6D27_02470 [Ruminiclostridium sp.]|nr:hypothetical protein [Ruminiclostridium sp.]
MSIKKAFDEITPTSIQKTEMLSKVKAGTDTALIKQRRNIFINRLCIVGAACLSVFVCVVALSVFINSTGKPISISGDRNSMIGLNSNINDSGSYADPAFPSDKSSKAEETSSSIHEIDSSIESVSSSAPETTTTENSETKPPETIVTDPPAPVIEYAENITLKFIGDASFTQRGILYLIAVDENFPDNDEILDMTGKIPAEEFYINTEQDGTKLLESLQCGVYVVTGPLFSPTSASGYTTVKIEADMSGTTVEIDLNTPNVPLNKVNDGQNSNATLRDLTDAEEQAINKILGEEITYNGKKYIPVDTVYGASDYETLEVAREYLSGYTFNDELVPNFRIITETLLNQEQREGLDVKLYSIKKSTESWYGEELYYMLINDKLYDSEEFSKIALLRKVDIPNINNNTNDSFFYKIYIDAEIIGDCTEIYTGDVMRSSFTAAYYDIETASALLKTENGEMITNKKVIFRYVNGIEYYNYVVNNEKPHLKGFNHCLAMDVDSSGNMTMAEYYHYAMSGFYLGVLTREDAIKMGGYPIYRVGENNFFEYMLTIPYEQFPDLCDDLSETDKYELAYNGDYEYPNAE